MSSSTKIIPHSEYPRGFLAGVGPVAAFGSLCACGRVSLNAECQGCGVAFCPRCWWRHSHTSKRFRWPTAPGPRGRGP
jgi:hypothetical protein